MKRDKDVWFYVRDKTNTKTFTYSVRPRPFKIGLCFETESLRLRLHAW